MRKPIAAIMLFAACAAAQWVPAGPGGGEVRALIAKGPFILVRSSLGLWRSDDGGSAWSFLPAPSSARALAASGPFLFAASGDAGGLARSADAGQTWNRLRPALPDSLRYSFDIAGVLFAQGRYLLAGSGDRIFRSDDQGETWGLAVVGEPGFHGLASLAAAGPDLYAGTADGAYRSRDSGASWEFAGAPKDAFPGFYSLAGDGVTLVAQSDEVAYRSGDGGADWAPLEGLPDAAGKFFLRQGSAFFASRDDAVFRSDDGGSTWARAATIGNVITVLQADGETLYAGTYSGGLYRSADGGSSWSRLPMPGARVQALCDYEGVLLAGLYEHRTIYRSADRGTTWAGSLPWEGAIHDLGSAITGIHTLLAGGGQLIALSAPDGRMRRSADGGADWIADTSGLAFTQMAKAGDRLYAIGAPSGQASAGRLYRSEDFGLDWSAVPGSLSAYALASIGPVLIAVDSGSLLRSADGGASWKNSGTVIGDGACLAQCGNDVFAASAAGLFRSADSGVSWQPIRADIRSLGALYGYGSVLFAGTAERKWNAALPQSPGLRGVLRSTDRGATWAPLSEGLLNADITVLTVSGTDLFAGTDGAGVWRRPLAEAAPASLIHRPGGARDLARSPARKSRGRVGWVAGPITLPSGFPVFDVKGRRPARLNRGGTTR